MNAGTGRWLRDHHIFCCSNEPLILAAITTGEHWCTPFRAEVNATSNDLFGDVFTDAVNGRHNGSLTSISISHRNVKLVAEITRNIVESNASYIDHDKSIESVIYIPLI